MLRTLPNCCGIDLNAAAVGVFGSHLAAGAVDVQLHVFFVLAVQVQHGGHQLVAQFVVHRLAQEDDPLPVLRRKSLVKLC